MEISWHIPYDLWFTSGLWTHQLAHPCSCWVAHQAQVAMSRCKWWLVPQMTLFQVGETIYSIILYPDTSSTQISIYFPVIFPTFSVWSLTVGITVDISLGEPTDATHATCRSIISWLWRRVSHFPLKQDWNGVYRIPHQKEQNHSIKHHDAQTVDGCNTNLLFLTCQCWWFVDGSKRRCRIWPEWAGWASIEGHPHSLRATA